jgi:hypothetical protein
MRCVGDLEGGPEELDDLLQDFIRNVFVMAVEEELSLTAGMNRDFAHSWRHVSVEAVGRRQCLALS